MKIIVFGTGSSADSFFDRFIPGSGEILFLVDNNKEKQFTKYRQYNIEPPGKIMETDFDYVVIASQYSHEIQSQLAAMGVPLHKIIPVHPDMHTVAEHRRYKEILAKVAGSDRIKVRGKMKIAVTNFNFSNSNGHALMQALPASLADKYAISLIGADRKKELRNFDVIVSSSFDGIYDGKHLNIELWHGFPIKRMGMMYEQYATPRFLKIQENRARHIHLIASYSHLYTTFFNACYPTDSKKYRITGLPRNDLLFREGSVGKLEKIAKKRLAGRNVIFYLPTWRKLDFNGWVDVDRDWSRLFYFPDEDESRMAAMLEQLDLFLVVKLHPSEYDQFKQLDIFRHERVFLLTEEALEQERIHLYELLPAAKLLITDYSSVFFDTLLIDLPVIFAPTDQQLYSENRGFLLEPYQWLTPGPTVHDLEQLRAEIHLLLEGNDRYKNARESVRQLVFKYPDDRSGERVWQMIDEFLSDPANHVCG